MLPSTSVDAVCVLNLNLPDTFRNERCKTLAALTPQVAPVMKYNQVNVSTHACCVLRAGSSGRCVNSHGLGHHRTHGGRPLCLPVPRLGIRCLRNAGGDAAHRGRFLRSLHRRTPEPQLSTPRWCRRSRRGRHPGGDEVAGGVLGVVLIVSGLTSTACED